MKHVLKFLILILIGVIILFSCLYFFITSEYFLINFAIPQLATVTKGKVKADKIIFSPLSSDIKIENLQIIPQENFFLKIGRTDISFNPLDLFSQKITLNSLILKDIYIKCENTIDSDDFLKKNTGLFNNNYNIGNLNYNNIDSYNPIKNYKINLKDISFKNVNIDYGIISSDKKHKALISIKNINLSIPKIKTGTAALAKFSGDFCFDPYTESKPLTGKLLSKIHLDLSDQNIITMLKSKTVISYKSSNKTLIDFLYKNENSGSMHLNITDFPLQPFFSLFKSSRKPNLNSALNNFSLTVKNIFREAQLNGSLQASFKDCNLPIFLNNYDIIKPFFIPITKLSELPVKNSELNNFKRLVKAVDYANDIKDGTVTLYFDAIDIKAQLNSNSVNISNAVFNSRNSPINLLEISGKISDYGAVKLISSINYNGIIIPMRINGSISEPKINFEYLTKNLIKKNTEAFAESKPIKTKEAISKVAENSEKEAK